MQQVTLQRHADVDLEFVGEIIADVNTDTGGDRWEELSIWKTDGSTKVQWVVQRIGRSRRPGESDVIHTKKCATAIDVRQALRRRDSRDQSRWYMTDSALDALDEAVEKDPRLADAAVERV